MRGESSRVRLRAIREHDLPLLYEASFNPQTASRWRYRGRTIPIDEFASSLFDGTLAQYMVEMKETRTPVGMVTAYDENISGLNCKVAFVRCGDRQPGDSGAVFEGVMLLISHIFSHFPYRKIYAEVPAYNMSLLGPGAEEEGVLREYYFHDGEFVDLHFISYSRASWQEMSKNLGW